MHKSDALRKAVGPAAVWYTNSLHKLIYLSWLIKRLNEPDPAVWWKGIET